MTTPASLIKRPEPDPAYTTALAREHLVSLLNYCEEADGDERFHRYHECGDQLRNYANAAGIKLDAPKGKPRPVIETPEPEPAGIPIKVIAHTARITPSEVEHWQR